MGTHRDINTVALEGGHPALDFVNSTGGMRDTPPEPDDELLRSYDDLLRWCVRTELLADPDAERLRRAAGKDKAAAGRAYRAALELRDLVYAVFRAIAEGTSPAPEDLERLRDAERRALAGAALERDAEVMRWTWPPPEALDDPLHPIAHAAVELLTEGPLARVKVCANCRWLFLDQSKNRSRRWCSMSECGTQIKQRRFVEERRRRRARER